MSASFRSSSISRNRRRPVTSTELRPYKKTRDSEAVKPMMRDEATRRGRLGRSGCILFDEDEDEDEDEGVVDIAGINYWIL